jgi:hypothetical protein
MQICGGLAHLDMSVAPWVFHWRTSRRLAPSSHHSAIRIDWQFRSASPRWVSRLRRPRNVCWRTVHVSHWLSEFHRSQLIQSHAATWRPPGSCVKLRITSPSYVTVFACLRNVVARVIFVAIKIVLRYLTPCNMVYGYRSYRRTADYV